MTRANVYVEHDSRCIGEIPSSAYPEGELLDLLRSLQGSTYKQFVRAMRKYIKDFGTEYLKKPVANWSFEYMWVPTKAPWGTSQTSNPYSDWDNWTGTIIVRRPDSKAKSRLGLGEYYHQLAGQWMTLEQAARQFKRERPAA